MKNKSRLQGAVGILFAIRNKVILKYSSVNLEPLPTYLTWNICTLVCIILSYTLNIVKYSVQLINLCIYVEIYIYLNIFLTFMYTDKQRN